MELEFRLKKDYEKNNKDLLVLHKDIKGFKIRKKDFRKIFSSSSSSPFLSYFWRSAERKTPIGKIQFLPKGNSAELLVEGEKVAKVEVVVEKDKVRGLVVTPYKDYPNLNLVEEYLKGKLKEFLEWEHPSKVSYFINIFLRKHGGIPLSRSGNFYLLRDNSEVKETLKKLAKAGNVDPFLFLKPEEDSMPVIKDRVLKYVSEEYRRIEGEVEEVERLMEEEVAVAEALSVMPKLSNLIYEINRLKVTVQQLCPVFLEEDSVKQVLEKFKEWKERIESVRNFLKAKISEVER